ncbi:type II secretion system protein GspM [Thiothrix unzii]|jgi:type II secretory pathway component PulM|uniref:type II secretion system protein GspM n=1 Tax=Thiothrix unzii TaxID=111769 RepID=UPI002A36A7C9|nr:type II secretion system protein GspM [Thiothrix unzii]MDX9987725.1 type II secretion system protein GspM [Thiothrix unzii]
MKVWWQNLNERERLWVTLAGVLVAAMLLWLTLGKALLGHYQLLQHDLTTAREVQQKMQQQRDTIMQARGKPAASASGENLYAAVAGLLAQYQLDGAGSNSQEKDENAVGLTLTGKPFDAVIRFLAHLEREYGAYAVSMTLKPTDKGGLVDAEIQLKR